MKKNNDFGIVHKTSPCFYIDEWYTKAIMVLPKKGKKKVKK